MTATRDPAGAARNRRAVRAAVVAFGVAVAGGVAAAVGYWSDHGETVLGLGLAASLTGIGFGLVAWAKSLELDEHVVEERPSMEWGADEREVFGEVVEPVTPPLRRRTLVGLLGASLAALVVGFVGPIGSLGSRPRGSRSRTAWDAGVRLVTSDGRPIDAASGVYDQLATVFPAGAIGRDDSQVVLMRLRPELLSERTVRGGAFDGWVAYSKICTHAGCSVGLLAIDNRPPIVVRELVCPCHQSVFDPVDGARPVGGPATRSLPQLPLGSDGSGMLVALDDFDRPVGPIAWDEV